MRRLTGLIFVVIGAIAGCPTKPPPTTITMQSAKPKAKVTPTPAPRSTPSPTPTPEPIIGVTVVSGSFMATPYVAATLSPFDLPPVETLAGPGTNDPSLAKGQTAFALGREEAGSWGVGPSLNRPRAGHAAGNVGNALIVAEGENRPSLEVFDPSRSAGWLLNVNHDPVVNPGTSQILHAGVMLMASGVFGKEFWTAGGHNGYTTSVNAGGRAEVFLYTAEVGFRTKRAADEGVYQLPTGVRGAAGGIIDGTFVVAGGYREYNAELTVVQRVNLKDHSAVTQGAPMPTGVVSAGAVVHEGRLYVIGGFTGVGRQEVPTDRVQVYDLATNLWTQSGGGSEAIPALPVALHSMGVAVIGGQLYVAGGIDKDGLPLRSLHILDIAKKTWRIGTPMPTARGMLALVPFDNSLWAIGGIGRDGKMMRTVETYIREAGAP